MNDFYSVKVAQKEVIFYHMAKKTEEAAESGEESRCEANMFICRRLHRRKACAISKPRLLNWGIQYFRIAGARLLTLVILGSGAARHSNGCETRWIKQYR